MKKRNPNRVARTRRQRSSTPKIGEYERRAIIGAVILDICLKHLVKLLAYVLTRTAIHARGVTAVSLCALAIYCAWKASQ